MWTMMSRENIDLQRGHIKTQKNKLTLVPWDLGTSVFIFSKTCSSNRSECRRCWESDSCCFRSLTSLCNLERQKQHFNCKTGTMEVNRLTGKERFSTKPYGPNKKEEWPDGELDSRFWVSASLNCISQEQEVTDHYRRYVCMFSLKSLQLSPIMFLRGTSSLKQWQL